VTKFEIGHVGMARCYSALKCAGEFIEINTATEHPKRRSAGMAAPALWPYGVATPAKFGDKCLAVTHRILRLRRTAGRQHCNNRKYR